MAAERTRRRLIEIAVHKFCADVRPDELGGRRVDLGRIGVTALAPRDAAAMERVRVLRVELEGGVVVGNRPMGVGKSKIDERAVRDRCRMMRPKPQRSSVSD